MIRGASVAGIAKEHRPCAGSARLRRISAVPRQLFPRDPSLRDPRVS
jgi:hypothetical protein